MEKIKKNYNFLNVNVHVFQKRKKKYNAKENEIPLSTVAKLTIQNE